MDDKGIFITFIDTLTGQIASEILNKIKEKTANTPVAIKIKDKLNSEKLNPEIKKILNESIIASNDNLDIQKETIKDNIDLNKKIIIEWIVETQLENGP